MGTGNEAVNLVDLLTTAIATNGCVAGFIKGNSMWPWLRRGHMLVVESCTLPHLRIGDIAVFIREGRFFAHRVIAVGADRVITKGDARIRPDPPLNSSELMGRVREIRTGKRVVSADSRRQRFISIVCGHLGRSAARLSRFLPKRSPDVGN